MTKVYWLEVEKVQNDASKVVAIAKKHRYEFTEDEYNDLKMESVAGELDIDSLRSSLINNFSLVVSQLPKEQLKWYLTNGR